MKHRKGIWRLATERAFKGSTSFANNWQWLFSIPAVAGLSAASRSYFGNPDKVTTGSPLVDGLFTAVTVFAVTWLVGFVLLLLRAPSAIHNEDNVRADELADRLTPKVDLIFDHYQGSIHETYFDNDPKKKVVFGAVKVTALTDTPIVNCVGELKSVKKLSSDGKTWQNTSFTESLPLEWSTIGWEPCTIHKNVSRLLNVFTIEESDPILSPRVKQLDKNQSTFKNRGDVFLLEVVVNGDEPGTSKGIALRIELGKAWDAVKVIPLPLSALPGSAATLAGIA